MEKTKITERKFLERVATIEEIKQDKDYMEYITKRLENLDKKNANKRESTNQENKELSQKITEILNNSEKPMSAGDIIASSELKDYITVEGKRLSTQKITYIMSTLISLELATSTKEKGIVKYSLIG